MKEDHEVKIEETPKEKFDRIQREFEELRQDLTGINQKVLYLLLSIFWIFQRKIMRRLNIYHYC